MALSSRFDPRTSRKVVGVAASAALHVALLLLDYARRQSVRHRLRRLADFEASPVGSAGRGAEGRSRSAAVAGRLDGAERRRARRGAGEARAPGERSDRGSGGGARPDRSSRGTGAVADCARRQRDSCPDSHDVVQRKSVAVAPARATGGAGAQVVAQRSHLGAGRQAVQRAADSRARQRRNRARTRDRAGQRFGSRQAADDAGEPEPPRVLAVHADDRSLGSDGADARRRDRRPLPHELAGQAVGRRALGTEILRQGDDHGAQLQHGIHRAAPRVRDLPRRLRDRDERNRIAGVLATVRMGAARRAGARPRVRQRHADPVLRRRQLSLDRSQHDAVEVSERAGRASGVFHRDGQGGAARARRRLPARCCSIRPGSS